ncbi:unnamed protein product [Paramecium sonneborni]|uniref:Uncharacterized protein n=1 Tax=Paramecium sonneborni TaxID=65129 RepID=A0A8S1RWM6_9CILI|nr:unnamed protein product [Paramecium sonneborni]
MKLLILKFQLICYYGKEGLKIGKWVELNHDYRKCSQVTHIGKYQNGKKIGIWDIYWKYHSNHRIGGGSYVDLQKTRGQSFKNKWWIELSDKFNYWLKIFYEGQYNQGKKIGIWNMININGRRMINLFLIKLCKSDMLNYDDLKTLRGE